MLEILLNPILWAVIVLGILSYYQVPQKHIALVSFLDKRRSVKLTEGWNFFIPFHKLIFFSYERNSNNYYFYGEKKIDTHIGAVEAEGDIAYSINKDISGAQLKLLDEKAPTPGLIASSLEGFLHVILHEALLSKDEDEINLILEDGEANTTFRETLLTSLQNTADNNFGKGSLIIEWTNFRMNPSSPILAAKESIQAMVEKAKAEQKRADSVASIARKYSGISEDEAIPEEALIIAARQLGISGISLDINKNVISVPDPIKIEGLEGAADAVGKLAAAFSGNGTKTNKDKGGK